MELPLGEAARLVKAATREVVGADMPVDAWIQPTQTFDGEGAIRIVILLPGSQLAEIGGEQLLAVTRSIWRELSRLGEDRIPLIGFARTEDKSELKVA